MKSRQRAETCREIPAVAHRASAVCSSQPIELAVEDRALKFAETVVAGDDVMLVPDAIRCTPAVLNRTARLGQRIVIRGDDAALAGGEVLAGLERERGQVAERSGRALPIRCAVGVRGIFDTRQPQPRGRSP